MIKSETCDAWATHIFHVEYQVRTELEGTPVPRNPHVVAEPLVLSYRTEKSQTAVCENHLGMMIDSLANWGKHARYRVEKILRE